MCVVDASQLGQAHSFAVALCRPLGSRWRIVGRMNVSGLSISYVILPLWSCAKLEARVLHPCSSAIVCKLPCCD